MRSGERDNPRVSRWHAISIALRNGESRPKEGARASSAAATGRIREIMILLNVRQTDAQINPPNQYLHLARAVNRTAAALSIRRAGAGREDDGLS